jgi:ubiquinone/menaquinone biosynthesis C-methylase UbiE
MTVRRVTSFTFALVVAVGVSARPARAQREVAPAPTPEKVFETLAIREGQTVCEVGAGSGDLTLAAARVVGPKGRVYSSELGEARVKTLQDRVSASGLSQITVVTGDTVRTNFPDAACDAVFMKDVYHHFTDPVPMNRSIVAALKPGARLLVIDFGPPPGREAEIPADRGKDGMHGIGLESLRRELTAAGLEVVSTTGPGTGTDRWFWIVVQRPS